ncbi:MAG: hypothetical protein A2V70_20680 [Planctomycetes bacterium RBG_13_63_9]|nr:MAG: hypothetical protein A2V70_20680 [Planctomycetes bacterium RBG_13_63_9]
MLAEGMRRGERLIGMHFFNPAQRMPLVEIIRRETTAKAVLATALGFAKGTGKTAVVVRNREGFLVNRLFIPYLKEAFWLLEDGATAAEIDGAMVEFGFAMGPLALVDMAGLDILVRTDLVMARAFPRHGGISAIAAELVQQGHLGQKTASGVYRYETGDYTPRQSEVAERIIGEVRRGRAGSAGTVSSGGRIGQDEITQRLVLRMVAEGFCVLEEGIVQRRSDIDAAMVLGTGFPDFRGGVLRYAEDLGLGRVVGRLERLAERHGQRFAPCRLLRESS